MSMTNQDAAILRSNRRRISRRFLPVVVLTMIVLWLFFRWVENRFGMQHELANLMASLLALALLFPVYARIRLSARSPEMTSRLSGLQEDRVSQRFLRLTVVVVVLLVAALIPPVHALLDHRHVYRVANTRVVTGMMLMALMPFCRFELWSRRGGPGIELMQAELMRAALHGLPALVVLILAALIYAEREPGSLQASIPAALYAGALLAHVSLLAQDRLASLKRDD